MDLLLDFVIVGLSIGIVIRARRARHLPHLLGARHRPLRARRGLHDRSLPGALLGGVVVGLFETLCAGYLIASYKDIYAFPLLIVVLMVRPTGLLVIMVTVKA